MNYVYTCTCVWVPYIKDSFICLCREMQQFYPITTPAGCEVWGLIVTREPRGLTAGFQCPRCYSITPALGEAHNCPVPSGDVYKCLKCDKDVYPRHTRNMIPGSAYYQCYWCGQDIRNTFWRQAKHARQCHNAPPTNKSCVCLPPKSVSD